MAARIRGQGRKKEKVNTLDMDDPALPAKRQASLADLLGERFCPDEQLEYGAALADGQHAASMLLRTLMIICSLDDEWRDAAKIPSTRSSRSGVCRARRAATSRPCGAPRAAGGAAFQRCTEHLTAGGWPEEGEGEADPGTFEYDWERRARERAFPLPSRATGRRGRWIVGRDVGGECARLVG